MLPPGLPCYELMSLYLGLKRERAFGKQLINDGLKAVPFKSFKILNMDDSGSMVRHGKILKNYPI